MQPFLLISAVVASYMCVVQGPCNWIKNSSRDYILNRLRYRNHGNHNPTHGKLGLDYFHKNHDMVHENRDYLHGDMEKFYESDFDRNTDKNKGKVTSNDKDLKSDVKEGILNDDVKIEYRDKDHQYDPNEEKDFEHDENKDHETDGKVNNNVGNRNNPDHRLRNNRLRQYHRQSSCRTPSGGDGNCISLYQCEPLMTIINKAQKSKQEIDLLRKSQCGFQGQTPKVCCADDSCFTPDGQQGRCVNLYSCPHIASMLTPPVPQDTVAFVQSSRCQGADQYSVCCGPPRTNVPNPPPAKGVCTPSAAPPDPRSKCCGFDVYSGDKIVGGNDTAVDQYPWMAIIEYVKTSAIKLLCGGVLISGKYVLTAGHCVAGPVLDVGTPRNVRLGEYDISNSPSTQDCVPVNGGGMDCTTGVTIIGIERTIPHPDYNPNHNLRRNDIALLRLRSLAPYTEFIRPICLPSTDLTASPPPGFILFAAGWGAINATLAKSNIKQHVDLPFVPHSRCQPSYSVPRRNVQLWTGQLCAGGERDKDSCKGDSGGPLMYENSARQYEVIGIVSFGPTPCGAENIPGVYTKVFHYIPWIRSQVKP